ncbi:MAG: hypothetical protein N2111_06305 [Candidatus Sumerlaeaceae bacterium]|nr:hypothetical protein [Candidatus Sumerlaeaceae bacterium]
MNAGRLSREEQLKRLQELREKKAGEQAQGEQQGEQKAGEEGERRLSREEQLKRLQELREKKAGEQAQGEQKPGEQAGEKPLEIRQLSREEQFQKLQELRKARHSAEGETEQAASKAKLDKLRSTLPEEQQKKLDAILAERGDKPIDRSNLRELLSKVRGEDTETARKRDLELSREKLTLLGSDVSGDKLQKLGFLDRKITREDIEDRLGRLDRMEARDRLSDAELSLLNEGRVPDRLRWRDRDRDGDTYNIININNINIQNNYFLRPAVLPPPPPRRGFGIDFSSGGFRFSYWDGRFCYDHDYAINVFVSLGKRRFDGFDGIIVGGRYYCYGWGWIDGCIDYGDCRIWVPGFWVPYTVEVCGPVDVWVPPVYEWVWTGCCWEQIQVDGGYFRRTMGDCRYVTRHYWVPGHYEYYRC